MDQATAVYDGSDQLAFTIFKEQRIEVPLEQVSPNLVKAVIAIEDQQFYEHSGFNMIRIGFAALANLRHRRAAQGGSTITQQLARLSFLTPDKTIRRKIQELILARRIESSYTKAQILELYLNKVYFGDGLYGVEAAVARVLRQAGSRSVAGGSGNARRPCEIAVDLRPDRQDGSRRCAPKRRAPGDARDRHDQRRRRGKTRVPRRLCFRTPCEPKSRGACISRSRSVRNW